MTDGFFAVDRRAWAKTCSLGLNCAAAYLVIARGTGGDNRTSRWSNNAVEHYSGMSRGRAAAAVKSLVLGGLMRVDEGGTRPRYYLLPAHEIPGCEGHLPTLSDDEKSLLAEMDPEYNYRFKSRRYDGRSETDVDLAIRLVSKGLLSQSSKGVFTLSPYDPTKAAEPDWIWLPNAIVSGAADETPPIALLRQTQNAAAMRLFIDCYHSHGLAEDGGIHWRRVRRQFSRHEVGQRGAYVVWGFQGGDDITWATTPFVAAHLTGTKEMIKNADGSTRHRDTGYTVFWEAWELLQDLGLMEIVAHIVEADNDAAEIVHPYAIGKGEPDEQQLASAAHAAGEAMLTPSQVQWALDQGLWLLPVQKGRLPNVQMVGIPRMRYRPHTKATAAWFARKQQWAEWAERYASIAESVTSPGTCNIKVVSR